MKSQFLRLCFSFAAALSLAVAQNSGFAFHAVVAFGDSYTDTGNLPSSPPSYYNGRFSNGPLWLEYLSEQLGFGYNSANDYALSGSESDELGVAIGRFGGTSDSSGVLFAIWSGNNDIVNHLGLGTDDNAWANQINHTVNSLDAAVDQLYQKGARNVLLFDVFDLTQIPALRNNYSSAFLAYIRGKIAQLNTVLVASLSPLRAAHPGLQIYLLDLAGDMGYLLNNYSSYGFTQVAVSALGDASLSDKSFSGPGSNYVFWDDSHPTTKTHGIIAGWARAAVPDTAPPGAVGLVSPSGQLTPASTVHYTWQPDSTATWYELYIDRNGLLFFDRWFTAGSLAIDSGNFAVDIPGHSGGNYVWWIRGWNSAGYGPWSQAFSFSFPSPGAVTLVSPTGSLDNADTLRYSWQADATSTWYELYIDKNSRLFFDHWFTVGQLINDSGNLAMDVSGQDLGTYQWWVRGWSPAGYGPWSSMSVFTQGAAAPQAPTGTVTDSEPTFSWTGVSGVTWYQVWLDRNGAYQYSTWINGATSWIPNWDLQQYPGTCVWWVRTWDAGGYGPWSAPATFTVPGS